MRIKFLILYLAIFLTTCKKDPEIKSGLNCNATVIGIGMDCGNTFLIGFNDDVTGLPNGNTTYYYAINLPEKLKVDAQKIMVNFREPKNEEMLICTTRGLSYPQVFIVMAE